MKPPLIVYIVTKLELGGAQKVCLQLFSGISNYDFSSTLISGTEGYLVKDVEHKDNVILLNTFTREISIHAFWQEVKNFFYLVSVLRSLKKNNPQVIVHTHSTKAGFIGRWAAWWAGIKKRVHTIHGFGFNEYQPRWKNFIHRFLEYSSSFITTHYICVSTTDTKTALDFIPGFAQKYSLIRAAVDGKLFIPAQKNYDLFNDSRTFIIGTIACFKPQKNIFDLLQAFEYAYNANNTLRLEIIGDGILKESIVAWIHAHHLENYITLHGWQTEVAPYMKRWHIFALSSLWEGLPCSVVEARLLKLPVVCYDTGGISDIIYEGKNGFLCKQGDWRSLGEYIVLLSNNKDLYQSLAAYQDNLHSFDVGHMIEQHSKTYQKVLGSGGL